MSTEQKLTQEQIEIYQKFSSLVGKILTYIESALPEGRQCDSLKKLVENAIYETRNSITFK